MVTLRTLVLFGTLLAAAAAAYVDLPKAYANPYAWQTDPPLKPQENSPFEYPKDTIIYRRSTRETTASLIQMFWYWGLVLMTGVVAVLYALLFYMVRSHFRYSEQVEKQRHLDEEKRMPSCFLPTSRSLYMGRGNTLI